MKIAELLLRKVYQFSFKKKKLKKGKKSHHFDYLYLYSGRTCKKNVHYILNTSLIFMGVKCRYLVFIRSNRLFKCFMLQAVFPTQPQAKNFILAPGCVEKYSVHETTHF